MSFKKNITSNYISQIYVTIIGIIMVPIYLRCMGTEAYGLIGFYAMLQAGFQLLDMGLTPTLSRETARFSCGAIEPLTLRQLIKALENIFICIAIAGATIIIIGSGVISTHWLKVQKLALSEVQNSIVLMAFIISLRWISGLYRGAINGFEKIVWLSGYNAIVATLRFVIVVPFIIYYGTTPFNYFIYQLGIAVIEALFLFLKTYKLLPKIKGFRKIKWNWSPIKNIIKFSLTIALTSSIWVLVTQTDKLILSKLLALTDYAYFSLAVLVASGITVISGPVSGALLPRLTKLSAINNDLELIQLYRKVTQFVGVITIPTTLVLAFFSERVLWMWTGNLDVANKASAILTLYALGNGILALAAFPYYLQYAKGDLKLHLKGSILFVLLLIPELIIATWCFGIIGAGYAWASANFLYFCFWVPKVHRHFFKGLHKKWLLQDVGKIFIPTIITSIILFHVTPWYKERPYVFVEIMCVGIILVLIAAASSSWVRGTIINKFRIIFVSCKQ